MAVTQTISSGPSAGSFPTNDTGSSYRFALVRGEVSTFSDDLADLVEAIIPGYAVLDNDEALIARWQCAAATATQVQELLAVANDLNPGTESEDVLTAIFTDRANPLPEGSLTAGAWEHRVPLVLLATDYEPFTSTPAPTGKVQFVDPFSDRAFLNTLAQLGLCQFYTHDANAIQD